MLDDEVTLHPNGNGAQLYLPTEIVRDSAFPLERGADCYVQTIPQEAVILAPADIEFAFPLQFRDPNRIDQQSTNFTNP